MTNMHQNQTILPNLWPNNIYLKLAQFMTKYLYCPKIVTKFQKIHQKWTTFEIMDFTSGVHFLRENQLFSTQILTKFEEKWDNIWNNGFGLGPQNSQWNWPIFERKSMKFDNKMRWKSMKSWPKFKPNSEENQLKISYFLTKLSSNS